MDSISITGAKILFEIPIFGGIPVTETQINSLIVIVFLTVLCLVLTHNLKVKPTSKRQVIAEWIVEKVDKLVHDNMGVRFKSFAPFVAAILGLSAFPERFTHLSHKLRIKAGCRSTACRETNRRDAVINA